VSDWKETEGDEWGPVAYSSEPDRFGEADDVTIDVDGELEVRADCEGRYDAYTYIPLDLVRALLRAHDLRTKAPGTECGMCNDGDIGVDPPQCDCCSGSGRNLTPAELRRWKGWAK
jgi:hypothetical protein